MFGRHVKENISKTFLFFSFSLSPFHFRFKRTEKCNFLCSNNTVHHWHIPSAIVRFKSSGKARNCKLFVARNKIYVDLWMIAEKHQCRHGAVKRELLNIIRFQAYQLLRKHIDIFISVFISFH